MTPRNDNGFKDFIVESAGLIPGEQMYFNAGINRCGNIRDGVSFNIGGGGWVIPFTELEAMYEAAKAERAKTALSEGR
jgi:hypothetical protein